MLTNYFWNEGFEGLMETFSAWLTEEAVVDIKHVDWKYVTIPGENSGNWYLMVVYSK